MTPIRLLPMVVREALLREHVETVDYIDPETDENYRPVPLPDHPSSDEDK